MSLNRRSNHLLRDMVMKMRSVFILLLIVAYAGPYLSQGYVYTSRYGAVLNAWGTFATVYKGNIIKNLIMDCQSYTKYRPNETTGGIFVSWRRKEELPTGA